MRVAIEKAVDTHRVDSIGIYPESRAEMMLLTRLVGKSRALLTLRLGRAS